MRGLWFVEKGRAEFIECGAAISRFAVGNIVPANDAVPIYDTRRDEKHKLLGTVFGWMGEHGLDV